MAQPVERTAEEKLTESDRKRKKAEKKVTDLSTRAIIQLSRARSDEQKIKLLGDRLAEKEALFSDLLRTVSSENMEAARLFIEIDIGSYTSRKGTPALDKRIAKTTQQEKDRVIAIVENTRDESSNPESFKNIVCNQIIDDINGVV